MGHVQEPHLHEGTSLTGRGGREVHGTDLGRRVEDFRACSRRGFGAGPVHGAAVPCHAG